MAYKLEKISEIEFTEIERIPTGFLDLDLAYGKSIGFDEEGEVIKMVGLPRQMVSIWAGEPGVGKSRICMNIGLNICDYGMRTLYIINEDTAENLRRWAPSEINRDDFYIASDCNDIEEQRELIMDLSPDLVVIDSLNMVANIRSPDDIKNAMTIWKDATQATQSHLILIAHMNKKGEIKGSTDIPHLADITCLLTKLDPPKNYLMMKDKGFFVLSVNKNRYGAGGSRVCFQHTEERVVFAASDLVGKE